MSFLHLLGICFPHKYGGWFVYDSKSGWRSPRSGEEATAACDHCNHKIYRIWK